MPALAGYLHYRMVDVSSLKVLMQLWHGSDAEFKKPEAGAHDALFDIRQSIAELQFYRSRSFTRNPARWAGFQIPKSGPRPARSERLNGIDGLNAGES